MSLADRKIKPSAGGRRYRIDEIREALDAADLAALDVWLADATISADRLSVELAAEKVAVSAGAIASYRLRVLGIGRRAR
jgi:hypothetical protein